MNREEMIQYIRDRLESAPDIDVEAIYWMVVMELGN